MSKSSLPATEKPEGGLQDLVEDIAIPGHIAPFNKDGGFVELDAKAEARLRWKSEAFIHDVFDLHIVPIVAVMYLFSFIDRTNIGNARLAGLEKDLKMSGYDYNIALSLFYISYIVFEIPSNVACKVVGPGRWIPFLTIGFGILSLSTAFIKSFGALLAIRFLLGAFEAGLLPGIAYFMGRWYRKDELVFRLALYLVTAPLAGAFGGLLASGILKLPPIGSVRSWESIFLIEGIITTGVGVISYFLLTDRPAVATWLNEEEKALAEARLKSESVASPQVLDKLHGQTLRQGIFNINTWLIAFIFLWVNVTVQGVSVFMPTIVSALYPKSTTVAKQLKTVPPYIVGCFFNLLIPYISWKTRRRGIPMLMTAPLAVIGFALFLAPVSNNVKYGATFLVVSGAFPFGPLCTSAAQINCAPDSAKASSIGTVVMIGNIGGLISTWTFTSNYAPKYIPGNTINLVGGVIIIITVCVTMAYQRWENKQREAGKRDHRLEGVTFEQETQLGHRHPHFRMVY